ncbi:MAG: carboxymuconolactone decarboxylase family protein [Planctomycetota bacterium]|jgi:uncharacterized peroxidase-related enzyme
MARLKVRTTADADAKTRSLLEGIEKKMGRVPNLLGTMANSPAVLQAYGGFSSALAGGGLSTRLREQIALTVAEANGCDYCLAAHSALGRMAGLRDEEIADSRRGASPDRSTDAALTFARQVVAERGFVSDGDVDAIRRAGFDDGGIAEIVGVVALSIFTNYFNQVADTEVDFPEVEPIKSDPAHAGG